MICKTCFSDNCDVICFSCKICLKTVRFCVSSLVFKDKYLVYGEYVEEGYSKNINKIFKKYPYGYYEYFNECLTYIKKDTLFKRKLYFIKHYILFSYLCGLSKRECIKRAKRYNFIIALLVIPGYIKASRF